MKRFLIAFGVVVLFCVGGIYAFLQIKFNALENDLKNYLIINQGYHESDILSIKAKYSKMPQYPVYVKFTDDPETTYVFTDRGIGDWTQTDPETPQRINKND